MKVIISSLGAVFCQLKELRQAEQLRSRQKPSLPDHVAENSEITVCKQVNILTGFQLILAML